jgi:hypothetical protein
MTDHLFIHCQEMEDEEIVQQVQKGVRSRFYKQGRYSVTDEKGTHHWRYGGRRISPHFYAVLVFRFKNNSTEKNVSTTQIK